MHLTARQTEIDELAKAQGRVQVDELAAHFDITPQTIRMDMNNL